MQIRKPGVQIRGSGSVNVTDPEHCIKLLGTALAHSCKKCSSNKSCMKAVLDLLKLSIICKYRMYLFGVKLQSEGFAERALGTLISICVLHYPLPGTG
jgi:hypothetical protein